MPNNYIPFVFFIKLEVFITMRITTTHASRLVRSSQNLSQKVDRFLILSTLVLSVRGRVPPLLLPDTPVDMLCSEAELFAMKVVPPPPATSRSDWDPERCISLAVYTHYMIWYTNVDRLIAVPPSQLLD